MKCCDGSLPLQITASLLLVRDTAGQLSSAQGQCALQPTAVACLPTCLPHLPPLLEQEEMFSLVTLAEDQNTKKGVVVLEA